MAFTAKILSWRFRHPNIVGCLLKRRPTKGGGVTGTPGPPLATPLSNKPGVKIRKPVMSLSHKVERRVIPSSLRVKHLTYARSFSAKPVMVYRLLE